MDHERSHEDGDKLDEVMLPGFRFHPTDEELVGFYLKRKIQQRPLSIELIKQLDIYKFDPWDLPSKIYHYQIHYIYVYILCMFFALIMLINVLLNFEQKWRAQERKNGTFIVQGTESIEIVQGLTV